MGRLAEDALARVYADATCFVFPSLSEGFGFPPLEAMARGIPTAVANASSLPEVTGTGAIRFDPLDLDAIADAVRLLTEDGALRTRLRNEGRAAIASRYTWANTATTAWDTIRSVSHA